MEKDCCACGWKPTFCTSHIQFGKYICVFIRSQYDLKVVNNELIYVLKK